MKYGVMIITALVVFVLDQLIKWWIVSNLQLGGMMPMIDGIVRLRYTQNRGAAFGMFQEASGILSIVSPIIIAIIIVVFVRLSNLSRISALAAGMIVGGALGNLIDRIRLGYVVDFVDVYGPHLNLGGTIYTFPVFNSGDIGITVGVILFLISLIFSKDPQPAAEDEQHAAPNQTHLAG